MNVLAKRSAGPRDSGSALKSRTLLITSIGYFIVILDTTAKNVALPRIGHDLHTSVAGLQWVVNGYLLVFAAFLLTGGALCDRYGARRIFAIGLGIFGVASTLSAVAQDATQLSLAQSLAGLGAALVTPASLALLATTFRDPRERGKALGVWATVAGVGTFGGPLIGGGVVALAGWQAVFLINIPIAGAGILLVRRWLPESTLNRARALDLPGQLSGITMLAALSYAIITAGDRGWTSAQVLIAFGLAAAALVVFLIAETRTAAPMFPLEMLRARRFSSAVVAGLTINFGTFGQLFLLTLYFQNVQGYTPLGTGAAQLPMSLVCVFLPTYAGRVVAKIGPRLPLAVGLIMAAAGALALTVLGTGASYIAAVPGLILIGAGSSIAIPAVAAAAMSGVAVTQTGAASGMLNTSRQTGAVLGVAVLGAVVSQGFAQDLSVAFAITAAVQFGGGLIALIGLRPSRTSPESGDAIAGVATQRPDPVPVRAG